MKKFAIYAGMLLAILLPAGLMASIDGVWLAKMEVRAWKNAPAGDQKRSGEVTLQLKSEGSQLTGTVSRGAKGKRQVPIEDGKLEGDRFSFTTVQKGKNGETRMRWSGTLEGDELKGTRAGESRKRGASFVAKRK
ncbi:MAG: hypothetical protein ABIZ80_00825 [Bryobacteraceae bacterium]